MSSPIDGTSEIGRQREEPIVLTLAGPLTQRAIARLGAVIADGPPTKTVIIDVSDISDFDSAGTAALLALQELAGSGRVLVVGVREATARLLAIDDLLPTQRGDSDAASKPRRKPMPGLMMVTSDGIVGADALAQKLTVALDRGISIVVADLADCVTTAADILPAIEAAGRKAERQGQELVLLNLAASVATDLSAIDLGSTTHIARPR